MWLSRTDQSDEGGTSCRPVLDVGADIGNLISIGKAFRALEQLRGLLP